MLNYGKRKCNLCSAMKIEAAPRGAVTARCMSREQGHYGRTLDYSKSGELLTIFTPAWCGKEEKNENKQD